MAGTVVLLGVVSMFTDVSTESVNAVLPKYLIFVVGLSPQAFGFVNGLYNGISALVRILGGWIADQVDHPKWVAFIGYFVSAISRVALTVRARSQVPSASSSPATDSARDCVRRRETR